MSNKLAFLKKAVLYAYQNPKPLVDVLNASIADAITEIKIVGPSVINVTEAAGGTATYTASAYSQYGDLMENAVVLSLKAPVEGVSLTNGVATIDGSIEDTTFVLKGTIVGSSVVKELMVTVAVREVDSIVVSGSATLTNDVIEGLVSAPYTAIALDADGEPVSATLAFALKSPVAGVSIHQTTGVVTLTSTVANNTGFVVSVSAANSAVVGEFSVVVLVRTAVLIAIEGLDILINDAVNGLVTDEYTAIAYAADNQPTSADITLALKSPVEGVSMADGIVTLTNAVINGTTFTIEATDSITSVTGELIVTVEVE